MSNETVTLLLPRSRTRPYAQDRSGPLTMEYQMAIIEITIAKAGKDPIPVDTEKLSALPADVYQFLFINGLKPIMERGLTKVKSKDLEGDELATEQARGREIVLKNLDDIYEGKIRMGSKAAGKLAGKVKTEALRIAKIAVKAAIKAAGERIKDYEAKEITALATQAIEENPDYIAEAQASLAKAEEKVTALKSKLPTGKPKAAPRKPPTKNKEGIVAAVAKRQRGQAQANA